MAERTRDEIIEQAVYAVCCVARHYGPGFNETGVNHVRHLLEDLPWSTDSCFRVDVREDDDYVDFHERIIWPDDWDTLEPPNKEIK